MSLLHIEPYYFKFQLFIKLTYRPLNTLNMSMRKYPNQTFISLDSIYPFQMKSICPISMSEIFTYYPFGSIQPCFTLSLNFSAGLG